MRHQPKLSPPAQSLALSLRRALGLAMLAVATALAGWHGAADAATRFVGPTSSQPMALTAGDELLAVANPDNNSVTIFDVRNDVNLKVAEVPVQSEPSGVAFLPDGASSTSRIPSAAPSRSSPTPQAAVGAPPQHITVGTEPYGLALTPNGKKLYVTNSRSNTISVIDTASDTVTKTITVNAEPRGLAITNDGDADDNDEMVYVTHFLSFPQAGKIDGQDDAKAGRVSVLSTATDAVTSVIALNPIADTGFKAAGRRARAHRASRQSGAGGLQVHHRRLSEPAQQHRHQGQLRVRAQHRRFAQWSGALRRQHAQPAVGAQPQHQPRTPGKRSTCTRRSGTRRRSRSCSSRSRGRSRSRTAPTKAT